MGKKKVNKQKLGKVIMSVGHPYPPEAHEIDTAWILARHFKCTVEFLTPVDDYKRKTADIEMLGVLWEIKCPIGVSKSIIRNQFRRASRQSVHIIIDTRRTKHDYKSIEKEVLFQIKERPYIKRVILIDKFEKVVEVKI